MKNNGQPGEPRHRPNARTRGAKAHVESALSANEPEPSLSILRHLLYPYLQSAPFTLVQPAVFSTSSLVLCAQLSSFVLHPKRQLHVCALPRRLKLKDEICSAAQHSLSSPAATKEFKSADSACARLQTAEDQASTQQRLED